MNNHIQQVKVTIAKMPDSVLNELEQHVYEMNQNEKFDGEQFISFVALVIGYGAAWDTIEKFQKAMEQQQRKITRLRAALETMPDQVVQVDRFADIEELTFPLINATEDDQHEWFEKYCRVQRGYVEALVGEALSPKEEEIADVQDDR